ncbi:ACT domain-containing protein [Tropicimonas aquimaris]|uniref:ACT domain-containing protein n=1 Tax=Tropicimonas aquimaris TaxID=914152 RepID=A0ABW3IN39_9RHOB
MTERVKEGQAMVRQMAPRLVPGHFAFRTLLDPDELAEVLPRAQGMFREAEGISVIVPVPPGAPLAMRQITLEVHSALDGVGLTAAVSGAFAALGIPCNMVAAHHHDHVFVPEDQAEAALDALRALAEGASS